jgi:hypothetical protein
MNPQTIKIDEVEYVRKDSADKLAAPVDGKPFVIVRSYGAGVFAGYLRSRTAEASGVSVVLDRCIRLWRWTGCSLSQVANDGVAGSGENKFSMPTDGHEICQAIEIIPATEKARLAIQGIAPWKL